MKNRRPIMAEERIPETTQPIVDKEEKVKVEKGADGEAQIPQKPSGQEVQKQVEETPSAGTEEKTPVTVQQRIDRMYARLQKERSARLKAEQERDAAGYLGAEKHDDDDEAITPKVEKVGLSEADVEAVLERKERDKRFKASETSVLARHPNALLEDGSFNMEDPFVKEYIDIGRNNPSLALMENGPELAEATVEKKLGITYKQGRVDEATTAAQAETSYISSSTVATPPVVGDIKLNPEQQHVARRMGMTDKQYAEHMSSKSVSQKYWGPKKV